jgi:hypothetical protein
MKSNLNLFKRKYLKVKHKKDGRIDPHHFWSMFVISALFLMAILLVFFTYFFITTSRDIDEEAVPGFDITGAKIKKIEQSLQKIEDTVSERVGGTSASQNSPHIVQ